MHNLLVPMQFSHRHSCIWIDFEPFQMQASTQKHSKNALSNAFLVSCTCVSLHNLAHFLASVKRFCCKEMNRATQTPFQTPCQTEKCMQSASKPREPACRTCPFCGSQLCNFVSSKLYQIVFHLNWRMHLSGSKTGFSLSQNCRNVAHISVHHALQTANSCICRASNLKVEWISGMTQAEKFSKNSLPN